MPVCAFHRRANGNAALCHAAGLMGCMFAGRGGGILYLVLIGRVEVLDL